MTTDITPAGGVNKKLLAALGGVVVLALVGVFVVMPLMAPETPEVDPAVAAAEAAAAAATEEPTAEPDPLTEDEELPPIGDTFEVFSARDPFDQLVSEEVAAVPVVDGEPTGDATPTTDGSEETVDAAPVEGEPVSAPGDTTSEDGTTVEVEDVFSEDDVEYVLLTANGTAYTLTEGETFATSWRVETIDDPCVTLLYGDQARLVCEGESIRK